jgi:hypothetical protein
MEHFDIGKQADGLPFRRQQHKPELPLPKISYAEFVEAQTDEKVKKALREADKEAECLEQEGKIRA